MCESDLISNDKNPKKGKSKKTCTLTNRINSLVKNKAILYAFVKNYKICKKLYRLFIDFKVSLSKTISSWNFSHKKHTVAVIEIYCHQSFLLSRGATCESLKLIPATDHNI